MPFHNVMDAADSTAEFDILSFGNHNGKFVVPIGAPLGPHQQHALERLMMRDWIRLIDIAIVPTCGLGEPVRVFLMMPAAREWYAAQKVA